MIGDDFMELRSVKEEVKKEYPKMGQVKSKKLKKCIPSKWSKIGITSFALGLILKNTAYATENTVVDSKADIVGELTQVSPKVPEVNYMCITAIVLSIVFAIRICN